MEILVQSLMTIVVCTCLVKSISSQDEGVEVRRRVDEMPYRSMVLPGDLYMVFLSTHFLGSDISLCLKSNILTSRVPYSMSVVYGMERVNSHEEILPGVKLGLVVVDTCSNTMTTVGQVLKFIPQSGNHSITCPVSESRPVIGFIGPSRSSAVVGIGGLLGLYQIPVISGWATSDDLSHRAAFGHFFRVIPPDSVTARAMVDIMVRFNWTYVAVVYEESQFGFNGLIHLRKFAKEKGVCIANAHPIAGDATTGDYMDIVVRMLKDRNARVVVAFTIARKFEQLFIQTQNMKVDEKFIWIFPPVNIIPRVTTGSIVLKVYMEENAEYKDFIDNISPDRYPQNPWMKLIWSARLDACHGADGNNLSRACTKIKLSEIPDYNFDASYRRLSQIPMFYGKAVDALIRNQCPEAFRDKTLLKTCVKPALVIEYLKRVAIEDNKKLVSFDESGAVIQDFRIYQMPREWEVGSPWKVVGRWSEESIDVSMTELEWNEEMTENSYNIPESVCAKPCPAGHFLIQGELVCCWDCKACRDNEYVTENGTGCDSCPYLTWPDPASFKQCLHIPPTHLQWSDKYGIALTALAGVGLLVSLAISFILIKFKDRKVMRGSSIGFMAVILLGLFMIFSAVLLFIARPTDLLCIISRVGFHLSCSLIFGPLLVKTNRVYQVFRASSKFTRVGVTARSSVAGVMLSFMLLLQVAIMIVSAFLWPILATESMPAVTVQYVELYCEQEMLGLILPLSYNMLILLLCCIVAFLTRKLPDNFNESWFILLSVSATLFVWIAFLPIYFSAFYASHKAALLALSLILNGLITVVCFFSTKIYALLYVDEKDIKVTNFETESFEMTSKGK